MVTSRILFTAAQKAELWERWKSGQSAAAISRALERKNKTLLMGGGVDTRHEWKWELQPSKRSLLVAGNSSDAMNIKPRFRALSLFLQRRLRRRSSPDIGEFGVAVREVIAARMARAMTGTLSAAEARLMIAEKQLAAVRAHSAYMHAFLQGEAASALNAYFDVYQNAVEF